MSGILHFRRQRLSVITFVIVFTVVVIIVVVNKLPRYYPSTAATQAFKRRLLGYPSVLYDCDTNHTDPQGAVTIPDPRTLSRMNHKQLSCLYYSYITNLQHLCRQRERLGRLDDGGWDVCVDEGYRPSSPCLVFSFGIDNDFTFDDAVHAKYGCEVHSFDPSMGQQDHTYAPAMYFHNTGLASFNGNSGGWRMRTLGYLRKEIDRSKRRKIDILKIDIERMEWEVLPEVIKSESFRDVRQLCVEFHSLLYTKGDYIYEPEREYYVKYLSVLQLLFQSGFRIFWTNKNFHCSYNSRHGPRRTSCHEVYFVQTELL